MSPFQKRNTIFYKLLVCLFFIKIHSQALKIPQQDSNKNLTQIILKEVKFPKDTLYLQEYLSPLKKSSNKRYHVLHDVLLANGYSIFFDRMNSRSDLFYTKSIQEAKKLNNASLVIWTQMNYSKYLYFYREMDKLTPVLLKTIAAAEIINPKEMILPDETFKVFGWIMLTVDDTNLAMKFLNKALQNTPVNSKEYAAILNAIGHCYFRKNDFSKANNYYNKAELLSLQNKDTIRYAKILGDKALVFEKTGNLKLAIQLLKTDISYSQKLRDEKNEMYASIVLVEMLLKAQKLEQAKEILEKAEKIAESKSYYRDSLKKIIELKLTILNGQNPKKELFLRRQLSVITAYLLKTDGNSALHRSNWLIQKTKYANEIKNTQLQVSSTSKINRVYVVLIFFITLLCFFIYASLKNRLRNKGLENDKKVMSFEIQKLTHEKKLTETTQNLNTHIKYLHNKNEQISKLILEIDAIKNSSSKHLEEENGKLKKLLDSHLMTDKNWGTFKREFINENPDFYKNLIIHFPHLKESNLKIIMLQKLDFRNSEIASLLGVTVDAIKKSKQRLKKKLGDKNDLLLEFLENV